MKIKKSQLKQLIREIVLEAYEGPKPPVIRSPKKKLTRRQFLKRAAIGAAGTAAGGYGLYQLNKRKGPPIPPWEGSSEENKLIGGYGGGYLKENMEWHDCFLKLSDGGEEEFQDIQAGRGQPYKDSGNWYVKDGSLVVQFSNGSAFIFSIQEGGYGLTSTYYVNSSGQFSKIDEGNAIKFIKRY